jgi:acyl carrier protein
VTPREQEIAAQIRRIVEEDLRARVSFGDEEELATRLDSLALLSLVVAVEDRFRVVLNEEDAAQARSLADLARLVAARTEREAAP